MNYVDPKEILRKVRPKTRRPRTTATKIFRSTISTPTCQRTRTSLCRRASRGPEAASALAFHRKFSLATTASRSSTITTNQKPFVGTRKADDHRGTVDFRRRMDRTQRRQVLQSLSPTHNHS